MNCARHIPRQIEGAAEKHCRTIDTGRLIPTEYGGMPEWLKGTDCKSVGSAYVGSNPTPSTIPLLRIKTPAGIAQW